MFRNLKLAWKLGLGFGTSLLLTVILSLTALSSISQQTSAIQELSSHQIPALAALGEYNLHCGSARAAVYQLAVVDGKERTTIQTTIKSRDLGLRWGVARLRKVDLSSRRS